MVSVEISEIILINSSAISSEATFTSKTFKIDAAFWLMLTYETHFPSLFSIIKDFPLSQAMQVEEDLALIISPIDSQAETHTLEDEIFYLQKLHSI